MKGIRKSMNVKELNNPQTWNMDVLLTLTKHDCLKYGVLVSLTGFNKISCQV